MKDRIKTFIAETTYTDVDSIQDNTMIFDEGIFDSMGLLGLLNYLESEFNIVTDDNDLQEENFGSVNRIAAFVERKMSLAS